MNKQDPAVISVVEKLKENALSYPWVRGSVPPRRHYHKFPDGLSICFTLDILSKSRYWHLSIARKPGSTTAEELEYWRRAFFDEEPTITYPGLTTFGVSSHFFWRCNNRVRKSSKNS